MVLRVGWAMDRESPVHVYISTQEVISLKGIQNNATTWNLFLKACMKYLVLILIYEDIVRNFHAFHEKLLLPD